MKPFHFILSSPDAVLYDGEVEEITAPTENGEISVLADHTPLVTLISPGMMIIKTKGEEKVLAVGSGFLKVLQNTVKAFTQTAEFAESIDEERAIEAKQQAEDLMRQKVDEGTLADASSLLERNIARLKVIERKHKRSHR